MLGTVLVVVVLLAGLAGADRLAAAVVARRIAVRLASSWCTTARPVVRLSWPLLPQLVAGVYREVRISAVACSLGGLDCEALAVTLGLVRAPVRRLLAGLGAVAGQVTATGTIGYPALSRRLPSGLVLGRRGDELVISGSVLRVPVSGMVTISADLRRISVSPRVAGVPWLVGFSVEPPALPATMSISAVAVTQAGLAVTITGRDVRLARAAKPAAEPKERSAEPDRLG